jgi:MOSC domain-containing protein YiiM
MTHLDETVETAVRVELLLVSRRHRYAGRPADGPLPADDDELRDRIELRAGLGIVGDRYFGSRAHVGASVTVFGLDAFDDVARELGTDLDPVATRRNVFLRGVDVETLRRRPFSLDTGQGPVLFRGGRAANPCAWMDHEVTPGAFRAMRGRGGVRCDPVSDGVLVRGDGVLRTCGAANPF